MKVFSRYLAIATVIALGLAFSPEVSADKPTGKLHSHGAGVPPAELPEGCKNSPTKNPNC